MTNVKVIILGDKENLWGVENVRWKKVLSLSVDWGLKLLSGRWGISGVLVGGVRLRTASILG